MPRVLIRGFFMVKNETSQIRAVQNVHCFLLSKIND